MCRTTDYFSSLVVCKVLSATERAGPQEGDFYVSSRSISPICTFKVYSIFNNGVLSSSSGRQLGETTIICDVLESLNYTSRSQSE